MSHENVELLRRITEAFNRGDFEQMFALADAAPEFEFVPSGVLIPDLADVQRGPEGLRRLAEVFFGEFDDAHFEVHELIDAGDQVFASSTFRGRGKRSDVETSWDVWTVSTVLDGPAGMHGPRRSPRSRRAAGVARTLALRDERE